MIYTGYLSTLEPEPLNKTLALMRELRDESTKLFEQSRPKGNTIAVGGGDFDKTCTAEIISDFLGGLSNFDDLKEVGEYCKACAVRYVSTWNSKREWQVHRYEFRYNIFVDSLKARFEKLK